MFMMMMGHDDDDDHEDGCMGDWRDEMEDVCVCVCLTM